MTTNINKLLTMKDVLLKQGKESGLDENQITQIKSYNGNLTKRENQIELASQLGINYDELLPPPNEEAGRVINSKKDYKKKVKEEKKRYELVEPLLQPWKDTKIQYIENVFWKEPCFSDMDKIKKNPKLDSESLKENTFRSAFWRAYYSIYELPLFGWRVEDTATTDRSNYGKFSFKSLQKFLFCFFVKICGSPLYIVYLVIRFIGMMLKSFGKTLVIALIGIINTFSSIIGLFIRFKPPGIVSPFPKYVKKENNFSVVSEEPWEPNILDSFISIFGMTLPYHTINKNMGKSHGKGEMGVFIFFVMVISAILITVTGINIVVIGGAFLYFLFKTLMGLKEKVTGRDLRQGGSTDTQT